MNTENRQSDSSHDELIQAWLDGETSPELDRKFRELLADPAFCERLADFSLDFACLHELAQQGVIEQMPEVETASISRRSSAKTRRMWVRAGAGLAASLAALFGLLQLWPERDGTDNSATGNLVLGHVRHAVSTEILRDGAGVGPAEADVEFRSGDTLQTEGPEGYAIFVFHDGTMLVLTGDAEVLVTQDDAQKRIEVQHGDVDADVAPQPPGKPMVFVTPQAEASVMGTRLSILAAADETALSVSEGHVVMKRLSDGRSVDVRGGYQAVASPGSELKARPTPPVPDLWDADFEGGLPDNWRIGQWISNDLPGNSRGAVRSVQWTTESKSEPKHYYAIRSNREITGLFRVHEDTYLNFRYKLDKPGWFNLFAVVRRGTDGRPQTGNYAHKKEGIWSKIPPGEWRTVSVPLTGFHKVIPGGYHGMDKTYAQAGDTVNSIWFSTPDHDRGLTIDRLWVTRGKPADQ